jgi:hypothetical protein
MYSVRPYRSENIEFNLPTTMYSIKPIIEPIKVNNHCFYFIRNFVYVVVLIIQNDLIQEY